MSSALHFKLDLYSHIMNSCDSSILCSLVVVGGFEYSNVSVIYRYVISSLELLVAEDYMIIYLNGATPRRRMPGISWLKRCYQMIDRRY